MQEDVILAVSASGSSPNVIHTCRWVLQILGQVIGLTGFDGGELHTVSHACIVVDSKDFGHIETAYIAIMHHRLSLFHERFFE